MNKTNIEKLEKLNIKNFGKKHFLIDQRIPKDKRYLGQTKEFPNYLILQQQSL